MTNSIPVKTYSLFAAVFCLAVSLIAITLILFPINGVFITPPYNEEKEYVYLVITSFLTLLAFTPQPIALASYYFTGGIGKNTSAHILFGIIAVSFIALLLTMLGLVVVYLTTDSLQIETFKYSSFTGNINVPTVLFGFLHFTIFPIVFTVKALVAKTVKSWQRFLPMISFTAVLIISPAVALVIFIIGSITSSQQIYSGFMDTTLTNWLTTASVAWALTALLAFYNKGEINEN